MTKKGYQKRLPTVLPRAAGSAGVPVVPAPRPSAEDIEVDEIDDVRASTPVAARRYPVSLVGGLAIGLACVLLGLALRGFLGLGDAPSEDGPVTNPPPAATRGIASLAPDESYVETRVLPDGTLVVRHWIRARKPLTRLRLVLPEVSGAEDLSATQVKVVAQGQVADGTSAITGRSATYSFYATTDVQVSYRLDGTVERSDSAAGRALAVATTLDMRYRPRVRRETRVVVAPAVLSLACSASTHQSPVPCGEADDSGEWQVELVGSRVRDRVVAQLTIG